MAPRIITGSLKGRQVFLAKGASFRPSTHYLREMLFSIIGFDRIRSSVFLDVFAGSGIVGFEAISRGAKKVIFLEIGRRNCEKIRENASRFNVLDKILVYNVDATKKLAVVSAGLDADEQVSLVFVDPPFDRPVEIPFLEEVLRNKHIFSVNALFFLETRFRPKSIPLGFEVIDQRKTSSSVLTTLRFSTPYSD